MKYHIDSIFSKLDQINSTPRGRLINQLIPVFVCLFLFAIFIILTLFFINSLLNPFGSEQIIIQLNFTDTLIGFFLYFITAVDYALIIGRMQVVNSGSKPRFVMNVFTCLGCFAGVSLVLFLWGSVREVPLVIIPLLIFAGSVMFKLAYEGSEYFKDANNIPAPIRRITFTVLSILYKLTHIFTFWIPELSTPKVERMKSLDLAKWAFLLPFIIGIDDLVGYMGAMNIYNVFSLIFGIYLADILIDILIFVSPSFTKKLVENSIIAFLSTFAFLYLGFNSFRESFHMIEEHYHVESYYSIIILVVFTAAAWLALKIWKPQKSKS